VELVTIVQIAFAATAAVAALTLLAVAFDRSRRRVLVVLAVLVGVTAVVAWSTMFKERTQRLRRDAVPDHVRVYEAIAARNPGAARGTMLELIDLAFSDATQLRQGRNSRSHR